jgi:peptidyl-dipeptidase A
MNEDFHSFLHGHCARFKPLNRDANRAYWRASISGSKSDSLRFAELQLQLQTLYMDKQAYKKIIEWGESGAMTDPIERRQLRLLHHDFTRNQVDPGLNKAIVELATSIENQFNVYRGQIDGAAVTNNDISQIMKESGDPAVRKKAWETSKEVGVQIADQLLELVTLRNEAARSLGFDDYYAMSLALNEQNEDDLARLFDELERLTAKPFRKMKLETDRILAGRYGLADTELDPWFYNDPFFQKAPQVSSIDLDGYFRNLNILDLARNFFSGIGLDVTDILERSDLFEKTGKEQHAYCIDIDRRGDIRVLANIKNDESWTGTLLHELGHAVYDKYIDPDLPYLLRQAAHTFTTEAVAMLFGRLSKNAHWIQLATGISDTERDAIQAEVSKHLRFSQLLFVRWCQVMFHFERELYRNPDSDLNELWWELVNRYQFVRKPDRHGAHDWASKIHIVSVPVYYHNYLLGELLASQLHHHIAAHVALQRGNRTVYNGNPAIGSYLRKSVFEAGARYRWDTLIERATGEQLTPSYFIDQFV